MNELWNKIEELVLKAQDSLKECPEIASISFRIRWPDLEDMEAVAIRMGEKIDALTTTGNKCLILTWPNDNMSISIIHSK